MTVGTDASSEQDLNDDRNGGAGAGPLRLTRTVPASPAHVWEVLVSPAGTEALLGHGATIGAKGQTYVADDGSRGVVRSFHPLEQLRVSWHASPDAPGCVIEIDLEPAGSGTTLDLGVDHVPAGNDAEEVLERFRSGLDALASLLG